jgi:nucleoside-diphosphate-sugar epimerase
MRILVTGSAGFIGSHLLRAFDGGLFTLVDIAPPGDIPHRQQDARDFFRENWEYFDLVIHCAALVGGRQLIENSPVAYAQNLELDAALFQWAERTKPGRVVYISSVAAYPVSLQEQLPPDWLLNKERLELQDAMNAISGDPAYRHKVILLPPRMPELQETDINLDRPQLPDKVYGWAKLTGEMLAGQSSVPVSVVRPFTVYGEGQDSIFPFANLIMQVKNYHDPITIWGSGNQVRDFIHVNDVVNAILVMAEQDIDGPVNLCTGRGVSLNEAARMIADEAKKTLSLKNYDPEISQLRDKTEGLPYRVGDPSRLHEFYVPGITLEDGIERGLRA